MSEPPSPWIVVGGGLAGCEAAWQAAERGIAVRLYEMRPESRSPAHTSSDLAELVCSNSLRAAGTSNAVGLLKEEMRRLGSLVIAVADACRVPAGRALAVDRGAFAREITARVEAHPRIDVRRERVRKIPDDPHVLLATGPLCDPDLAADLQQLLGEEALYFYDSISPVVHADSLEYTEMFRASRWEDGEGDYWNLPLDRAAYETFVARLLEADTVPLHPFERDLYFEGCLPIEEMARRGPKTLAFGPMKPVGLREPKTGDRPYAVVQLRREDRAGRLWGLVGFQTKMRIAAQRELFRSLPGMGRAVFARFGSVHRNTFVNAPRHLDASLALRVRPGLQIAGQMAGVEGYVESAALGALAGLFATFRQKGSALPELPSGCAHAALLRHLGESAPERFQPTNITFGLFPELVDAPRRGRRRRRERYGALAERALGAWDGWLAEIRLAEARLAASELAQEVIRS